MSSSMLAFALLRNSSDLHIYKDLYGEWNKPEKKKKKNKKQYDEEKCYASLK